ncbi:hypothetical protein RMR10_008320 [Agrobacterium rosae]|uniref:hypothetical protein n=1 Tax=Agrobacterium rosae TaxID=1972867 RepID=UPI002A0D279F|nr:hypothetical protein [Agrobacterium rosae]MDX8316664.1 hypothetical protein [Agrobacterium rosae]
MRLHLNPSVPEIARVNSSNLEEAVSQLIVALTPSSGGFNYLPATKTAKTSYKGLHDLKSLTAARALNDGSVGAAANFEVAKLICPIGFGRKTQVIDLAPRSFHYGSSRKASYRVPFLFVEGGVVKAYFLQPRKNTVYSSDNISIYFTILKKYLLDTEFYGEPTDVEFVEVAERSERKGRELKICHTEHVKLLDDATLAKHLSVVHEALNIIENENLVTKNRRPLKDRELPLFD